MSEWHHGSWGPPGTSGAPPRAVGPPPLRVRAGWCGTACCSAAWHTTKIKLCAGQVEPWILYVYIFEDWLNWANVQAHCARSGPGHPAGAALGPRLASKASRQAPVCVWTGPLACRVAPTHRVGPQFWHFFKARRVRPAVCHLTVTHCRISPAYSFLGPQSHAVQVVCKGEK